MSIRSNFSERTIVLTLHDVILEKSEENYLSVFSFILVFTVSMLTL